MAAGHSDLVCDRCSKQFAQNSSLLRHVKRCQANAPAPARRKACQACAISKSRCDLLRPECSRCVDKGITCTYALTDETKLKRRSVSKDIGHVSVPSAMSLSSEPRSASSICMNVSSGANTGDLLGAAFQDNKARLPQSSLNSVFAMRVIGSYARMFGNNKAPPFTHWTQYTDSQFMSLRTCRDIMKHFTRGDELCCAIGYQQLGDEMDTLRSQYQQPTDSETILANSQAFAIYAIQLLFSNNRTSRTHQDDQRVILDLQEMCVPLAATGLVLPQETSKLPGTLPSWNEWILFAAKRRTILIIHAVIWTWSMLHDYPPFDCREIFFMPTTCEKTLWQARTESEWMEEYLAWKKRWEDKPHTLAELQGLSEGVELTKRNDMWLEEIDEMGMLVMIGVGGKNA